MSENSKAEISFSYNRVILIACFLILMIVFGGSYSFGVFLKPLLTEFDISRSVTAGAYSLNLIMNAVFNIIAGRACDRFGPRLVVTISGIFLTLGYLLMTQINAVWQIYVVYGMMLSIGTAGIYVPLLSTIVRWYYRKPGLGSGIVSAGIGVGMVFGSPLASFLISSYNWRISYLAMGLLSLLIPAVLAQLLKRAPGRDAQAAREVKDVSPGVSSRGLTVRQALRSRQLWMIGLMFLVFNLCLQTITVHLVAFATDSGITATVAATLISTIGIASIISKIGIGTILDRTRCKPMLTAICIVLGIAFLLLLVNNSLTALYVFAVIFAAGYGAFSTSQSPVIAEYFGLREHGAIFGIVLSMATLGSAFGPYIAGYIFDVTGSYNLDFIFCAVLLAIALIVSILLKPSVQVKQ